MLRVKENADDVYLDSGQRLEEQLASVDHEVWKCPKCGGHTVLPRYSGIGSVRPCPKCNRRTLQVRVRTLVEATNLNEGKQFRRRRCASCGFHDRDIIMVPALLAGGDAGYDAGGYLSSDSGSGSSSGSGGTAGGGSSGGGQSSGGGASGKW
jgi:uncharacterized protein